VTFKLPRLKENDGITDTVTGKALRGFSRFWDKAMTEIENKFEVVGQGIVAALGDGTGIARTITGGYGIDVADGDGVAGNPTITALGPDGFGFFVGGLMTDGELLGGGIFDTDISFPSLVRDATVKSEFPATNDADLTVTAIIAGVETQIGTIGFDAGGTDGTPVWVSNPYLIPAGTPIRLYAPSPRDVSLSMITALIPGDM
jgi:hypothetical protein